MCVRDADGDDETTDLVEPPQSPSVYTNYGTNAIDPGAPGGDVDLEAVEEDVLPWYQDLVLNTIAVTQFDDDGNFLGATTATGGSPVPAWRRHRSPEP